MSWRALLLVCVYVAGVTAVAAPLGTWFAHALEGRARRTLRILGPLERLVYRVAKVRPDQDMPWKQYASAVLWFHVVGASVLYAIQRLQGYLPLNPSSRGAVPEPVAFNTAVSFATNTNWQAYGGETSLSVFTQMLGLTVQNFVSAAAGIAVLLAFIRGFQRADARGIGNFWVDLTRATLYLLLPVSLVVALVLVSQGVVQTLDASVSARLLDPTVGPHGERIVDQVIALGPVASQEAIKQLGTNGGGFFNVNAAHPFENPTAWTNLVELGSILLIPIALCFTFGALVQDRRQGWAVYAAMTAVFVPLAAACIWLEGSGNPVLTSLGVDQLASVLQAGGNMEGKEVRFGPAASALWATATTSASSGSVNAMHDSFTPLGGMVPLWLIQLGEVIYGGVGSGLYGMLVYVIVAVFMAGLMVGRTPEVLGKKIETFEMKMAAMIILVPAAFTLLGTALACSLPAGTTPLGNPGAHGFSEILYAFSSGANNNGSAFAGLTASGPFYAIGIGVAMLAGRLWIMVPVLALAGSLAGKKAIPPGPGTLPTHTPVFVGLLLGTVLLVGALTFIPALALGPIAEQVSPGTAASMVKP